MHHFQPMVLLNKDENALKGDKSNKCKKKTTPN